MLLVVVSHAFVLAVEGFETALVVPTLSAVSAVGVVWLNDYAEGHVGMPSWTALLAPLVYLGHGMLTLKSVFEYLLTWEGEWYRTAKSGA
jgi:hypothetical protein